MGIAAEITKLHNELPSTVKLVAVSKFHPASAVMEAYNAGQRVFGENRPQELAAKAKELPRDIEWHFIGHLQTNKLKMVLPYATLVESVDSLHLLEAIDRWGRDNSKVVDVLLEYHVAAEETKQGFDADEMPLYIGRQLLCLGKKFLRTVLAEHPLPGIVRFHDGRSRVEFGNRHQLYS